MESFTSYRSNYCLMRNRHILVFSRTIIAIIFCKPGNADSRYSGTANHLRFLCYGCNYNPVRIFCFRLGNGIINMVSAAIRQLILLVPCLLIFIKISGISHGWYAVWIAEIVACIYSYYMSHKLLKTIFAHKLEVRK